MCRGCQSLAHAGLSIGLLAILLVCPAAGARAQARSVRALRSIDVEQTESGWSYVLELDFPIRYLRHTPQTASRVLRILVDPVRRGRDELPVDSLRESLPLPRGGSGPLVDVFYDGSAADGVFIELQFAGTLAFRVEQGADLRSLRIRADLPAAKPSIEGDSPASPLLVRARHAIRDGQLDLAIALLTRVLEMPAESIPVEQRMDARELLGLTHERRGQLAHAAAEYETYLAEHPEGPAATRVRQRLEAIRTAHAAPTPARRPPAGAAQRGNAPAITRELFGGLGARYYRSEAHEDDTDLDFAASNFLTDANLTGRIEADRWRLQGDFAGTYDLDLEGEGRSDDVRVSQLSARLEDRVHGLDATLGRQRRTNGGVLGRFDGVQASASLGPRWRVSALGGMPVLQWSDAVPDPETWVFGGAVDFQDVGFEGLQGQLYLVGGRSHSMTDRSAVGGELRHATDTTFSFLFLDYDFVFQTLNDVMGSTTWRATEKTDLRAALERRNAPFMTLSAALQGQDVDDLGELRDTLSESDIRDLAADRAAVAWMGSVGATHRPSDRLQLSADFAINHISETETSQGVVGTEASGPDFGTTIQLLMNDWLVENGVGSVSVRYFEGEFYRSFMTLLYSRFTLPGMLRASPRLRLEWRDSELQDERTRVRPSVELDWRRDHLSLFGEVGGEWEEPISGAGAAREFGYFLEAGVRWDF